MFANINCNPLQTALKFKTIIESRHILSLSISNYTVIPSFDFCSLNFDWILNMTFFAFEYSFYSLS